MHACMHTMTLVRPWQREEEKKTSKGGRGEKNIPEVACKLHWNADLTNEISGIGARVGGAGIQQ